TTRGPPRRVRRPRPRPLRTPPRPHRPPRPLAPPPPPRKGPPPPQPHHVQPRLASERNRARAARDVGEPVEVVAEHGRSEGHLVRETPHHGPVATHVLLLAQPLVHSVRPGPATQVHHVIPRARGGQPGFDHVGPVDGGHRVARRRSPHIGPAEPEPPGTELTAPEQQAERVITGAVTRTQVMPHRRDAAP